MWYDDNTDSFYIAETKYTDGDTWKGTNINTDDGIKHLYSIGAYSWVWDAVENCDRRYLAQQVEEFIYYYDTYKYYDEYDHRREETVESITEEFKNLDVFYQAICIMRNDETSAETKFEKLGGILNV
jgi:hypothetical protein